MVISLGGSILVKGEDDSRYIRELLDALSSLETEIRYIIVTGGGQTGSPFCGAFGTTTLFDDATLSMLYPTRQNYIDAIDAATDSAVEQGFILPEDGDLIKAQALNSNIGGT